jgi:hypothetical protein
VIKSDGGETPTSIRSRVIAAAEDGTGTAGIDAWIVQDVLARNHLAYADARVQRLYPQLLWEAEMVRQDLAVTGDAGFGVTGLITGTTFDGTFTGADVIRVLDAHGFFRILRQTVDRALVAARVRGYEEHQIDAVLLIGAGWTMPCLKERVQQWFGEHRVHADHPVDAVARGAAGYRPGAGAKDCILHDYAIRYWDAGAREHRYRFLVREGTRYPSAGQVGRFVISAAYDGQTHLGIPVYRIGPGPGTDNTGIELVSDRTGGMRMRVPSPDAVQEARPFWVNERAPLFLIASPPAQKGEPRFELTFTLDPNRQLCLTARDVVTGIVIKQHEPVYRLT